MCKRIIEEGRVSYLKAADITNISTIYSEHEDAFSCGASVMFALVMQAMGKDDHLATSALESLSVEIYEMVEKYTGFKVQGGMPIPSETIRANTFGATWKFIKELNFKSLSKVDRLAVKTSYVAGGYLLIEEVKGLHDGTDEEAFAKLDILQTETDTYGAMLDKRIFGKGVPIH